MSDARDVRTALTAGAGAAVLRILASTWRVRFANPEVVRQFTDAGRPFIHLLWHGQLLPLLWTHRRRGVAVMVSEHRDGELIARVAQSLGFRTIRGSSTRGAARALLGACRAIEEGQVVAITVDGPRGPAGTVAPGSVVISQRTGAPMVPTGVVVSRAWRLGSWDRFIVPKPFARLVVTYGAPVHVDANSPRDATHEVERVRDALVAVAGAATA